MMRRHLGSGLEDLATQNSSRITCGYHQRRSSSSITTNHLHHHHHHPYHHHHLDLPSNSSPAAIACFHPLLRSTTAPLLFQRVPPPPISHPAEYLSCPNKHLKPLDLLALLMVTEPHGDVAAETVICTPISVTIPSFNNRPCTVPELSFLDTLQTIINFTTFNPVSSKPPAAASCPSPLTIALTRPKPAGKSSSIVSKTSTLRQQPSHPHYTPPEPSGIICN